MKPGPTRPGTKRVTPTPGAAASDGRTLPRHQTVPRRPPASSLPSTASQPFVSPIYLTETMAIWISRGLHIREFPSHYIGRNEGISKLRLIDLLKASIAIFECQ